MPFKKGELAPGAIPFKKGQSGNPSGKPKKIPELKKLLADVMGEEKDGIEAAKAILLALRGKAVKGDVKAAELLLDRTYGKPKQTIDLEAAVKTEQTIDLSKLTDDELRTLAEMQSKSGTGKA